MFGALHVQIDYEEDRYKSVVVVMPKDTHESLKNIIGQQLRFESGDAAVDYARAMRWIYTQDLFSLEFHPVLLSSSVDGFVFDCPGYHWEQYLGLPWIMKDGQGEEDVDKLVRFVKERFTDAVDSLGTGFLVKPTGRLVNGEVTHRGRLYKVKFPFTAEFSIEACGPHVVAKIVEVEKE